MIIKNKSTKEGREFWAHIEEVARTTRPLGYIDAVLEYHEDERARHLSDIEFVNQNARGK